MEPGFPKLTAKEQYSANRNPYLIRGRYHVIGLYTNITLILPTRTCDFQRFHELSSNSFGAETGLAVILKQVAASSTLRARCAIENRLSKPKTN